ncbi:MAG TPA: aminoacyl-tRNA hydrolase [Pyrinomonadaceae bacterium]|nr:aminoacyl-tRNA hydrolase [Pyrinomonadaceae bacterium]
MLIVGLGNPGKEYAATRHNLGFMLIDKLASDEGILVKRRECESIVGQGPIEGDVTKLVKPQTYMNLSGIAVSCLLRKVDKVDSAEPVKQLVVISDDLALPLGKIRIRERGSAGGHNGLKSIIAEVGTDEFIRLRIGIQPDHPISDSKKFVLEEFSASERPVVEETLAKSVQAVRTIIREGVLKAMMEFN